MEQLGSHGTDFKGSKYLSIIRVFFEGSLKCDKSDGYLAEDLGTFVIISRLILLIMGSVSDKIEKKKKEKETQITHFMFNTFV